jgi:hypothetical protein
MIFISKREKVPVKGALSLQLLLPKIPHPGEMLQQLTQLERLSTLVQVEGERRSLPQGKLRVHISSM